MSQSPATIGRFQVINRIGRGGMGSLYLAWDPVLERQIAIKLLREDMEELRERFDREARSVARLRHPHIVTIFDVGQHDGQPFIAMEYIHGQTLGEIIRSDFQPPISRKLKIIDELCDGLGFAHKMAIIHRDVKPANVMVEDEGGVKILDFGIARIAESGMTMAGMLIGTLNYMSPEQIAGQVVDNRSDIFAIGAVMFELLARQQAFPGGLQNGIINRILNEQPPGLKALCPALDDEVVEIVRRALEKDPQSRYQDLATMRKDLQRVRQRVKVEPDETVVANAETIAETVAVERPPEKQSSLSRRRGTPRESLDRLRATQLAAHLESARRALDAEEFEGAISAAEHALLLEPEDPTAAEIIDRARGALDERSVHELVRRATDLLEAGALTEARGLADQALTIAPGSPAAVELRHTLDRLYAERERERQRLEAVRAATARAQRALAEGLYDEALAAADEALQRAPESEPALQIQLQAHEGIAQARKADFDRLAQQTIDEARRMFEAGQHARAVGLLTAFDGDHPHVSETLEALTREKARLEREAARARKHLVKEAIARANGAASHEIALEYLREASALDPAHVEVAELLAQRQDALERERDEARQVRERQQRIADGLARAAAETSHEAAIAILESLTPLGPDHQDVRQTLEARRAALERQREEMRRAEARRRRLDALLDEAARTPGHQAAVALLKEAHALDAARADVRKALHAREGDLRKEQEERRRLEEREAQIATAMQRAEATGSDEEALRILRTALALDPAHRQLQTLLAQRQAAFDRKQDEARKERERQARIAGAIAKASATPSHEAAMRVLAAALNEDPGHPELTRLLNERRAALEQQEREEHERREQVAAALDRAQKTPSHAEAVAILEQVTRLGPEHGELRAALSHRQAALAREREEARRERERQERIATAIRDAKRATSTEAALGLLETALALAPEHEELRQLVATTQASLAREREEARKLRERQARVAALLGQVKTTASHEHAIELLREILSLEAGHPESQTLLERRQAALEQERAAAARLADIEAARRSIAQAIAAGDFERAEAALKEAERTLSAGKLLKAERRQLKQARATATRSPAGGAAPDLRTGAVAGLVAVLALVLVVGYLALRARRSPDSGREPAPPQTLAQGPSPSRPAEPDPTPENKPPATAPTEPPSASGGSTPGAGAAPDTAPKGAPADSKVAADVRSARDSLEQGQLQRAADAVTRGLRIEPQSQELRTLARTVLARARQAASDARARATGRGESAAGSQAFREAQARQAEAGRRERANQYDGAVRLYDEAAQLYSDAARTALAPRPAPPAAPSETAKAPVPTEPPTAPPSPAPPSPQPATPSASGAGAGTAAAPSSAGATTASPPVAPPAKPTPTTTPPPQSSIAADQAAIRATLREYAAAYESLNVDAVRMVYPSVNAPALERSFRELSSQQVQISGDDQITIEGATAVVRCQVRQAFTPRVGQGRSQVLTSVFRLQKTGGRWVIVERR